MELIGQGTFSKVYKLNKKQVYIKSIDPVKEALSLGWCGNSHMIPKLNRVKPNEYIGTYYPKVRSLKKALKHSHYKMYKDLRALNKNYSCSSTYKCEQEFRKIKNKRLSNILLNYVAGIANYGENICFEISPRNVAVSPTGGLVLLDIFYDKDLL